MDANGVTSGVVWFNYATYMENKLAQVKVAEPDTGWTASLLAKAFSAAGFPGEAGAFQHFVAFGQFEDVSPNAFFVPQDYYVAKAASYYEKPVKDVTPTEIAFIETAIADAGMNAWSHYQEFGTAEGINPSDSFNTVAYLNAKVAALNAAAYDGKDAWTIEELCAALQDVNMSALEHFMVYGGGGKGEVVEKFDPKKPVIPDAFKVPVEQRVHPEDPGVGETFVLTNGIDTIAGTVRNDTVIGDFGSIKSQSTLNAADQIDGGEGDDTLQMYGAFDPASMPSSIKNVENIEMIGAGAAANINLSKVEGLKAVSLSGYDSSSAKQTLTVGEDVAVTLKEPVAKLADQNGLEIDTKGENLDLTVVDSANAIDLIGAETTGLALTSSGKDKDGNIVNLTNTGDKLETITVEGDAAVKINANLVNVKTVDASANKGGVTYTATTNELAFTGGEGNDKLIFATASDFGNDSIDFGKGDNDTLSIGAAKLNAAQAKNVNEAKGLDTLELNGGTTGTGYEVNAEDFADNFQSFHFSKAAVGATATAAVDGKAGIQIDNIASDGTGMIQLGSSDATVAMAFAGGAGVAGATAGQEGDGGVALEVSALSPGTTRALDVKVLSDVTLTGGAGATGTSAADAGVGADLGAFNAINFNMDGSLTVSKGGTAGTTVADTLVNQNAVVTLSGKGNANLGLVSTDAQSRDASASVNIDASDLDGGLTVSTGGGDDTIIAGSKDSIISGGKGADMITAGLGKDVFGYSAGDSGTVTSNDVKKFDVITDFQAGTGGDVLDFAGSAVAYTKLSDANISTVSAQTTLLSAASKALELCDATSTWTAFEFKDKIFAVYDTDAAFDGTNGILVELNGVSAVTELIEANFA